MPANSNFLSRCELQFEYGLRGKRSRPLLERPASFKSTSGKEIKVNKELAIENNVVTSKGKVSVGFLLLTFYRMFSPGYS
jgi:hypothetical protein